jgi:DMSO/TMAO reductase YedYZ heme-binding membrane subunit
MKKSYYSVFKIVVPFLLFIFVYAIIRYNLGKGVDFALLPTYILNKAVSTTAIFSISLSYLYSSLGKLKIISPGRSSLKKQLGIVGFFLALSHLFLSLSQLNPERYPKFFLDTGFVNTVGEFTFLFGLLAFISILFPAYASLPESVKNLSGKKWLLMQRVGYLAILFVIGHTVAMGYTGWIKPESWPFYIPPISLIGSIVAVPAILLRLYVLITLKK